jgi:hypothetical protein
VGWKHTCSRCSHAGFERIGSRSGYNPVEDIYILQRPSSCDPHFRYSEMAKRTESCRPVTSERQLSSNRETINSRTHTSHFVFTYVEFKSDLPQAEVPRLQCGHLLAVDELLWPTEFLPLTFRSL